jgi:hypothetical protein
MQIFRPGADTIATLLLASLGAIPVVAIGLAYQIAGSPYMTAQNVTVHQPVPFSREHHVGGLGLDCRYCRGSVEKARFRAYGFARRMLAMHARDRTDAARRVFLTVLFALTLADVLSRLAGR